MPESDKDRLAKELVVRWDDLVLAYREEGSFWGTRRVVRGGLDLDSVPGLTLEMQIHNANRAKERDQGATPARTDPPRGVGTSS